MKTEIKTALNRLASKRSIKRILFCALSAALILTAGCASEQFGPCVALSQINGVPDALPVDCVESLLQNLKTLDAPDAPKRMLLFSDSGADVLWMGERDDDRANSYSIYRQEHTSYGLPEWLMLERILEIRYQRASTHRYRFINDVAGAPEKVGSLSRYSPFYIQGSGLFFEATELDTSSSFRAPERLRDFLKDGEISEINCVGVPFIYCQSRLDAESGGHLVSYDIVPDILYKGGVLEVPDTGRRDSFRSFGTCGLLWLYQSTNEESGVYANLFVLGSIWMSYREKGVELHGPLWGMFGWGKNSKLQPVIRLLWIPIPIGQADEEATPAS